jgi:hypothetical protein
MSEYLSRFQSRLQANHAVYLKQLILFLDALKTYSQDLKASLEATVTAPQKTKILTCAELMQQLGRKVESLNLIEIATYLHNSKVVVTHPTLIECSSPLIRLPTRSRNIFIILLEEVHAFTIVRISS